MHRARTREAYRGLPKGAEVAVKVGKYGPYIRAPFPENKVSNLSTGKNVSSMPAAADGSTGWIYNPTTGELRVNTTGTGPSGTAYFDL